MRIPSQSSFLLSYSQAERGTEYAPQWGLPCDVLQATYLQGPTLDQDRLVTHWDRRWCKDAYNEELAGWTEPSTRLMWMGRTKSKLFRVGADGKRTPVKDSQGMLNPKWEPRQKRIYYRDPRFGLLLRAEQDGGGRTPLSDAPTTGFDLTSDGRDLIYCQSGPDGLHIHKLDLRLGSSQPMTLAPGLGGLSEVKLSRDRGKLAGIDSQNGQVKVVDLKTGEVRQASDPVQESLAEDDSGWTYPYQPRHTSVSFSPDGSRLIYVRSNTEQTESGERSFGSIFVARDPWAPAEPPALIWGGRNSREAILIHEAQVAP